MLTKEDHENHGRKSVEISRRFVKSLKFEPEIELSILYGIATHEDGIAGFEGSATVLSKSISDADYLDRYDVYHIYETLEFFEFSKMETEEKIKFCKRKIINLEKLFKKELATNYAKKCFHEELLLQKMFFEKMLSQFENSKEIF